MLRGWPARAVPVRARTGLLWQFETSGGGASGIGFRPGGGISEEGIRKKHSLKGLRE